MKALSVSILCFFTALLTLEANQDILKDHDKRWQTSTCAFTGGFDSDFRSRGVFDFESEEVNPAVDKYNLCMLAVSYFKALNSSPYYYDFSGENGVIVFRNDGYNKVCHYRTNSNIPDSSFLREKASDFFNAHYEGMPPFQEMYLNFDEIENIQTFYKFLMDNKNKLNEYVQLTCGHLSS